MGIFFSLSGLLAFVILLRSVFRDIPPTGMARMAYALFSAVLLYGYIGVFGQLAAGKGGLSFIPASFEWPVLRPETTGLDSKGNTVVGLVWSGRVQVYDDQGRFLRGWFVASSGKRFKLQVTPSDQIEVFTQRGRNWLTYNLQGVLLSKRTYTQAYGLLITHPSSGRPVTSPWPLWPLASLEIAMVLFFGGGAGSGLLKYLGNLESRRQQGREGDGTERDSSSTAKRRLLDFSKRIPRILDESPNYVLAHEFEQVFIFDRYTGKEIPAGDHYGNPECGVIAPDESWFATAGEGIVVYSFKDGLREYFRPPKKTIFITAMRFEAPDRLRFLIDPWSDEASVWWLFPTTGKLEKLHDGPDLRDEPYREDVPY